MYNCVHAILDVVEQEPSFPHQRSWHRIGKSNRTKEFFGASSGPHLCERDKKRAFINQMKSRLIKCNHQIKTDILRKRMVEREEESGRDL
jgi:hypothetical protein